MSKNAEVVDYHTDEIRQTMHDLRDLNDAYSDSLDTFELDRWPEFFTDDCVYKVISRENYSQDLPIATIYCDGIAMVRDRVLAIENTAVFEQRYLRHVVSGLRIDKIVNGSIHCHSNFIVFESVLEKEPRIFAVGQYVDAVVRQGKRYRFQQRFAVYDNYRLFNSLIYPI